MDDKEFLRKVGLKISIIRKSKKLSQEKLAEMVNSATSYIGTIERGEQNPSLILLKKISEALEVDIREFFNFVI
ncbi:MAG: hypothetical protein A2255_01575 [Candidatus Melainabacteria bacterium RIFOXYA2_FULL_32_9]|nr:MAG: hypothetical protein A2255_01575 [Candidatus Melainabacteria bacterium RIFOXYA2_FULL_32_9]